MKSIFSLLLLLIVLLTFSVQGAQVQAELQAQKGYVDYLRMYRRYCSGYNFSCKILLDYMSRLCERQDLQACQIMSNYYEKTI